MNDKKQHEQRQQQDEGVIGGTSNLPAWHRPAVERLRVALDTADGTRGSGGDFGVEPEIFGG